MDCMRLLSPIRTIDFSIEADAASNGKTFLDRALYRASAILANHPYHQVSDCRGETSSD